MIRSWTETRAFRRGKESPPKDKTPAVREDSGRRAGGYRQRSRSNWLRRRRARRNHGRQPVAPVENRLLICLLHEFAPFAHAPEIPLPRCVGLSPRPAQAGRPASLPETADVGVDAAERQTPTVAKTVGAMPADTAGGNDRIRPEEFPAATPQPPPWTTSHVCSEPVSHKSSS